MNCFYLGSFPPKYGGVTIKNRNLYKAIGDRIPIGKVDFNKIKRLNVIEMIRLFIVLASSHNRLIVGISGRKNRRVLSTFLYICRRNIMNCSVLMVMGGTLDQDIKKDTKYLKYLQEYKKVYVETRSLCEKVTAEGLTNAEVYPNCRFKTDVKIQNCKEKNHIKCLYFSLIQREKGVDMILEAAMKLPEITFDFYGGFSKEYENEFLFEISKLSNVHYRGIFSGGEDEKYRLMSKYDVLILPTRCPTEGVPGVLIEGKISGVAEIVSNHNYNSEIVIDKKEGIVLNNNSVEALIDAIKKLDEDIGLLEKMKQGSRQSANRYYIESYIDQIMQVLVDE